MKKSSLMIAILLLVSIIILFFAFFKWDNINVLDADYTVNVDYESDDQILAVAYLGDISEVISEYDLENIKTYQFSGEDTYLIVPRYNDMEIKVYKAVLDEENVIKEDLMINTNLPFVITCDKLKESSNIILEIKYEDILFDYLPIFNDESSSINVNEYILDITK